MDHRELLQKYMEHVALEEGTAFLDILEQSFVPFEKEEIQELRDIAEEITED